MIKKYVPKTPQSLFRWEKCDKSFSSHSALSAHVISIHKGRIFTCDKCGVSYKSYVSKYTHSKTHPEGTTFTVTYNEEGSSTQNRQKLITKALQKSGKLESKLILSLRQQRLINDQPIFLRGYKKNSTLQSQKN